jgi:hypothetical protein
MKLLFLTIVLSMTLGAAADLKWDKTSFSYKANLDDKGTEFIYKVKNTSAKDIVIPKGKSSCACMTLATKFPLNVSAGSEVSVEGYFDFTGKIGLNRGTVTIYLAGGEKTELVVEVEIPVPVTLAPRFLIWKKGPRSPKSIKILLHPEYKGSIDKAYCADKEADIDAQLLKNETGYVVTVTPGAVPKKRTWVFIEGKDPAGVVKKYRIFLIFN